MNEPARKIDQMHVAEDLSVLPETPIQEDYGQYELASANHRVVAIMIDGFALKLISMLFTTLAAKALATDSDNVVLALMANCLTILYFTLMQYNDGQTLGKKIMRIKVVSDRDSSPLGIWQVMGRETIGRILSIMPFGLGYLGASTRKDRKTFHDRVFKTHVIRLR